jgi:H+/gluconate symporter-like permease
MGEHVVPLSFTAGVGNLMRHIAIILGLGARGGFARNSAGGSLRPARVAVGSAGARHCVVGRPVLFDVGAVLMLAVTQFHADLGRTIVYGLMVGLPAGGGGGRARS